MEVLENIDEEERNKEKAKILNQENQKRSNEQGQTMVKIENMKYLEIWVEKKLKYLSYKWSTNLRKRMLKQIQRNWENKIWCRQVYIKAKYGDKN